MKAFQIIFAFQFNTKELIKFIAFLELLLIFHVMEL